AAQFLYTREQRVLRDLARPGHGVVFRRRCPIMRIESMSLQSPMTRLFLALTLFTQAGLQPGTGIVTGSIRTAEGRPATGMRVAAIAIDDPEGNNLLSIAQTDSAGRYKLPNIPEGSYYIVAGRVTRLTFYPSGSDAASAQKI